MLNEKSPGLRHYMIPSSELGIRLLYMFFRGEAIFGHESPAEKKLPENVTSFLSSFFHGC